MFKLTLRVVVRAGTWRQRFNGNVQTEITGSKLSLTETKSLHLLSRRLPATGQLFEMVFTSGAFFFWCAGCVSTSQLLSRRSRNEGKLLREVKVICLFDLRHKGLTSFDAVAVL